MPEKISEMTPLEFREMVEGVVAETVERKLVELLGDPDEGKPIRRKLRERLVSQQRAVAAGERGRSLDAVVAELGLK